MLTMAARSLHAASRVSIAGTELRAYRPTWSPGPTPSPARWWASRFVRSSSSAYVTDRSPLMTATRSPNTSVACSKRSAKFSAMGTKLERVTVLGKPPGGPASGRRRHPRMTSTPAAPSAAGTDQPHLLTEQRGAVLIVTMNRPEKRNALSGPMLAGLREAWDRVDGDPGIRACVLTGAGGAFCAGADLKAMNESHPGSSR